MATTITAGNSTNGAAISSDNTGILELKTGTGSGTTAITVNASQNVGIGTSSPRVVSGYISVGIRGTSGALLDLFDGSNRIGTLGADVGGVNLSSITSIPLTFSPNGTEQARITTAGLFQFNSGYGSVATAFGCRAWVNFNGTGTVAIRASGNVTSITDNNVGDYTVNFTTAMPDANYAAVTGQLDWTTFGPDPGSLTYSTTAVRFLSRSPATAAALDRAFFAVAIFR
jgi:hypothetical protein